VVSCGRPETLPGGDPAPRPGGSGGDEAMTEAQGRIAIYLEVGSRRTFAAALEWPGWARSGSDEAAALASLLAFAPRYSRAVSTARLGFRPPHEAKAFVVQQRLQGDATTDFGAPGAVPSFDEQPLAADELKRQLRILRTAWQAFDAAARAARGRELRTGPRGGGRNLAKMNLHAYESEQAYVSALGWKARGLPADPGPGWPLLRVEVEAALAASARGEIPATGPRGGRRWTARTFVRRAAWHLLDHAWELEDRLA
jgi:hypothetical protein